MIWIRLCFKELWFKRQLTGFFLLTAVTGLLGLALVQSLSTSLSQYMDQRAALMLGGDLKIESSRPMNSEESAILESLLPEGSRRTSTTNFVSMAGSRGQSRLIRITGIEEGWPLKGDLKFSHPRIDSDPLPRILATPDAAVSMNLNRGDWFHLAGHEVQIGGVLEEDPASAFSVFGLAPRIYMLQTEMDRLALLSGPSRIQYEELILLPKSLDMEAFARTLRQEFRKAGGSSRDLEVETARQSSRQLSRLSGILTDWLGLSSAAVLLLAGAGLGYLFRTHLMNRTTTAALLRSLGASPLADSLLTLFQAASLGFFSALLTFLILPWLLPSLTHLLKDFLPHDLKPALNAQSILLTLGIGTLSSVLFCLPNIVASHRLRPWALMASEMNLPHLSFKAQTVLGGLSLAGVFALTFLLSRSFYSASIFTLTTAVVILLGRLGLFLMRSPFEKIADLLPLWARLATRRMIRNPASTLSTVLAIAFATTLLVLIPELRQVLIRELNPTWNTRIPSLFVFDIQDEQTGELQSWLQEQKMELSQPSPMIRARLRKLNQEDFDGSTPTEAFSREAQTADRFRRRAFNLSIREELSEAETITEGTHWKGPFDGNGVPGISVEERFAERMNLKLGDHLVFDILGVEVAGKIVSLRRVRWNSFEPNFFVMFQPGVLEDAPKSWVASVREISEAQAVKIQAGMLQKFGNISSVVVARITREVTQIARRMLQAVESMSLLSLLAAFAVLIAISWHEGQNRQKEIGLMKALGSTQTHLGLQILGEFFLLGLGGAVLGIFSGFAISLGAQHFVLEQPLFLDGKAALILFIGLPPLTAFLALTSTLGSLKIRPETLLADA